MNALHIPQLVTACQQARTALDTAETALLREIQKQLEAGLDFEALQCLARVVPAQHPAQGQIRQHLEKRHAEALRRGDRNARLLNILAETLNLPVTEISLDSHFIVDLGADSVDEVEILMSIEDAFDVAIPDEVAQQCQTARQARVVLDQLRPQ